MSVNRRSLVIALSIGLFFVSTIAFIGSYFGVRFNQSPSVSGLFYYTSSYSPEVGRYVFVCPSESFVLKHSIKRHFI